MKRLALAAILAAGPASLQLSAQPGNKAPPPPIETAAPPDVRVIDGDTLVVNGERIRLTAIDAPELDQPFGDDARRFLMYLIGDGESLQCRALGKDRYKRTVASCSAEFEGERNNLSILMVLFGRAVPYTAIGRALCEFMDVAKTDKHGIWSEPGFIEPSIWRHGKRASQNPCE